MVEIERRGDTRVGDNLFPCLCHRAVMVNIVDENDRFGRSVPGKEREIAEGCLEGVISIDNSEINHRMLSEKIGESEVDITLNSIDILQFESIPNRLSLRDKRGATFESIDRLRRGSNGEIGSGDTEVGAKFDRYIRAEEISEPEDELRLRGRHERGRGDVRKSAGGGRESAEVVNIDSLGRPQEPLPLLFYIREAIVAVVIIENEMNYII